jgi:hypothetical protein
VAASAADLKSGPYVFTLELGDTSVGTFAPRDEQFQTLAPGAVFTFDAMAPVFVQRDRKPPTGDTILPGRYVMSLLTWLWEGDASQTGSGAVAWQRAVI